MHSFCFYVRLVKNEWWGAGMGICLGQDADLHMVQLMPLPPTVSCFIKIQIGFTFLIPAHQCHPGKGPLGLFHIGVTQRKSLSLVLPLSIHTDTSARIAHVSTHGHSQ